MNSQLLIVLFVCAALLLMGGCFMLLAVLVFIFLRAGSREPAPVATMDTARVQDRLPHGASVPAPVPPPAPPPLPAALSGHQPLGAALEDEGAKTEVFQRGMFDWDADEEGEATEIFRADLHGNKDDGYSMD